MNKPDLKKVAVTTKRGVSKRTPQILAGVAVVGFVGSIVMAVKATPKAMQLIEEEIEHKAEEFEVEPENIALTPAETIKAAWKPYIPSAALALAATGCIIGSNKITFKRTAALTAAAQLSREALKEYREKTLEVVGKSKERQIRDKVAEERIKKNPVSEPTIIVTGDGNTLCYDMLSGRYFKSNPDKINKALNDINYILINENYISLSSFYEKIGLEANFFSDNMGWNIDRHGKLEIYYSSQLTKDNQPVLAFEFNTMPDYEYYKMYY